MRILLLAVLMAGCGGTTQCREAEVACQPGVARCFMQCVDGEWVQTHCAPSCGPDVRVEGANGSSCARSAVSCEAN